MKRPLLKTFGSLFTLLWFGSAIITFNDALSIHDSIITRMNIPVWIVFWSIIISIVGMFITMFLWFYWEFDKKPSKV